MTEQRIVDQQNPSEVQAIVNEIQTSLSLERIRVTKAAIRQVIGERKKGMTEVILLASDFVGLANEPIGKLATRGIYEAIIYCGRCLRLGKEPSVEIVKDMHTRVVRYTDPEIAGEYRQRDVYMSDGAFTPSSWERIPEKMQEYEKELKQRTAGLGLAFDLLPEVLEAASWAHCRLAKIQPFLDGNKRTTRLFTNFLLMRHGLMPVTSWEPRQEYFRTFYQSLDQETPAPFTRFLAAKLVDRYAEVLRKISDNTCSYYQDINQRLIMLQRMQQSLN